MDAILDNRKSLKESLKVQVMGRIPAYLWLLGPLCENLSNHHFCITEKRPGRFQERVTGAASGRDTKMIGFCVLLWMVVFSEIAGSSKQSDGRMDGDPFSRCRKISGRRFM